MTLSPMAYLSEPTRRVISSIYNANPSAKSEIDALDVMDALLGSGVHLHRPLFHDVAAKLENVDWEGFISDFRNETNRLWNSGCDITNQLPLSPFMGSVIQYAKDNSVGYITSDDVFYAMSAIGPIDKNSDEAKVILLLDKYGITPGTIEKAMDLAHEARVIPAELPPERKSVFT